jgi:hypothetical protein
MYGTAMISREAIQQRLTECLTGPWGRPMPVLEVEGSVQEAMGAQSAWVQLAALREQNRRRWMQERNSPTPSPA